jgi:hypothetical protein
MNSGQLLRQQPLVQHVVAGAGNPGTIGIEDNEEEVPQSDNLTNFQSSIILSF